MDEDDCLSLMVGLLSDKSNLRDRLKNEIEYTKNSDYVDKLASLRKQVKQLEVQIKEIEDWYTNYSNWSNRPVKSTKTAKVAKSAKAAGANKECKTDKAVQKSKEPDEIGETFASDQSSEWFGLSIPKDKSNEIMHKIIKLRCIDGYCSKDVAEQTGVDIAIVYSTTGTVRRYGRETLKKLGFTAKEIREILDFMEKHPGKRRVRRKTKWEAV